MKIKTAAIIFAILGFALLAASVWLRPRSDKIVINVLDAETRAPIKSFTFGAVEVYKVPILSSIPHVPDSLRLRVRGEFIEFVGTNGHFYVNRPSKRSWIHIHAYADDYEQNFTTLFFSSSEVISLSERAGVRTQTNGQVTIFLKPK